LGADAAASVTVILFPRDPLYIAVKLAFEPGTTV
jgi:hypothetical protein